MATLPPNSLLARSRQTRSGAATSKSSLSASVATSVAALPVATSNINLFLTNLRLLDFPSYPDWPDFDAHTFSVQKKRTQGVEWALYQLFVLWDPEEARNKLQPFFPPRDHVQSLNLRAALLRSLEQAKKNGVLGRDAVVRKTMLDECKGERLEEVLAVFSSVVLKKIVADVSEAEHEYPAVAQQLALENRGYSAERNELVALALAHRVSITNAMRRKDEARKKYRHLAELLDLKEKGITRRKEHIRAAGEHSTGRDISDDKKLDAWRTVRNNWAGNERWMETLLYGDTNARKDGLLMAPFDRVWRRLHSGRLSELEDENQGLLEQLHLRVKMQKERLAKWQNFRQNMFGDRSPGALTASSRTEKPKRGIDLGFDLHDNLHLGRMSPRKQLAKKNHQLMPEYAELLDGCKAELDAIGARPVVNFAEILSTRSSLPSEGPEGISGTTRESLGEETISELSELEDDGHLLRNRPRRPSIQDAAPPSRRLERPAIKQSRVLPPPLPSPPVLPPHTNDELSIPPPTPPLPDDDEVAEKTSDSLPCSSPRKKEARSVSFETEDRYPEPEPEPHLEPESPESPTRELADRILEDMNNASPSPVKRAKRHTLSLAERTRLSMTRSSHGIQYELDDDEEDITLALRRPSASRPAGDLTINITDEDDDLVSRTRKSMAGFEAARQKAQLERQRSLKKSRTRARTEVSQTPDVGEETMQLDPDASLLAEELMAVEDMEAVFRSRPRIKTSPVPSPSRIPLEAEDV